MSNPNSHPFAKSQFYLFLFFLSICILLLSSTYSAEAISPDIVISQVYGGGGNSGATYTHDYIELFNRSTSPVSLAGWSVQYASATGTGNFGANSGQLTELPSIMLDPGQYLLVQEATNAAIGSPLPTPDVIDATPINMSGAAGKVALVNTITGLGCNGGSAACSPTQLAMIIDLVGYGNANFFEGSAAAPGLSNTTADFRAGNGCIDTDDNSSDFTAGAPAPRNTASPLLPCAVSGTPEVIITEIMYDPNSAEDDWEWIEIYNAGTASADLTGYVVDDFNSVAHSSANIASGTLAPGEQAVLYNVDDVSAGDFAAAWGTVNLIPVTNWSTLALNNGGDKVSLWDSFANYSGDNVAHANAIDTVDYAGAGFPDPIGASIYLTNLGADNNVGSNWATSTVGGATPLFPGYQSLAAGGNVGTDIGSPGTPAAPPTPPFGVCGDAATLIHDVQGNGLASPLVGDIVTIEGVVVSNFQGPNQIGGYHVQEQDADADANPLTSEGIHVFDNTNTPSIGDVVRVQGTVAENFALTRLQNIINFANCGSGGTATAATVSLPVASVNDFERYEGMSVTIPQTLYISEFFNFDRFGEIVLTTDRFLQPTAEFEPGSPAAIQAMQNLLLNRITLDDGRGNQNPDPAIHPNGAVFDLNNLFRGGDTVANVTGVMDFAFSLYRIQPTQGADYTSVNPRTAQPDGVSGNLKVASFNVLNYFTTIDTGAFICGPAGNQECRGADDADELTRQRDKIIAAIAAINADVVGLIEIENHPADVPTADLVSGLNDALGAGTYAYIATGAIGTDAIRLALIYKPATVTPIGAYAVLNTSIDPRFLDNFNRPVLAQSFEQNMNGAVFTLAVNHLKSKGSDCNSIGDPDTGDGSGNCNLTRTAAAEALVDWLATDPTGSGDEDFLIIGDLNSYDKEDPIDAIKEGTDDTLSTSDDYTDLVFQFQDEDAYSYLFDGQLGYLDHALAGAGLVDEVTGVTIWHINADEADLIDYDTTFKLPAQDAIYAPDAYRSSDHDPVIIGLDLNGPPACGTAVASQTSLWPPNHRFVNISVVGVTDPDGDSFTITINAIMQDEAVNAPNSGNTSPDGEGVGTSTARVRAERVESGNGRVYHIYFTATDTNGNSCSGEVLVGVPADQTGGSAIDDGALYDSTVP